MGLNEVTVQPKVFSHVVLGLGATGLSVVRYLSLQGITPLVMDTRKSPPGASQLAEQFPDVELHCGHFDCRYIVQAEQIIISPGVALSTPEVRAALDMGIEVIGDVELFARELSRRNSHAKVIGITGSNGKTTVTSLVGLMAEADGKKVVVGGNIGTPALDLLPQDDSVELYVLELSSFQLETTHSLDCTAATCLNICEDHMDRYRDFAAYREAKMRLYQQTKCCVFNRQDPLTIPSLPAEFISFGVDEAVGQNWGITNEELVYGAEKIMPIMDVAMLGQHNLANILAAMALSHEVGISRDAMIQAASKFTGLPHRCAQVGNYNQVRYINDSKATNVGATLAALKGFKPLVDKIILIAGGDGKGANFEELEPVLSSIKGLITLGKDGEKIAKLREDSIRVKTLSEAVTKAANIAEQGDLVLLSPACASLDMYPNYMARGDDFSACVEALNEGVLAEK